MNIMQQQGAVCCYFAVPRFPINNTSSSSTNNTPRRLFASSSRFSNSKLLTTTAPLPRSHISASSSLAAAQNNNELDEEDGFYMRKCVELARKGVGFTSPNPMVGCVIVNDAKLVGQGFHPKPGQPHAEVFALRDAGDLAENATAYVSLEPCNHFGRTPPCTQALIKAKIKKVVVGMVDPNPIVASKGIQCLRDAGIQVVVGVEEQLCKTLNEAYIHRILTGNPLITLRYSISLNANFLDSLGNGVTDSGGYYSTLLQEYDAVILFSSLFTEENSSVHSLPSSQEPGANQPIRILIHKHVGLPNPIPTVVKNDEDTGKVIIFTDCGGEMAPGKAQQGVETVYVDQINLDAILDYCNRQGLCSVLLDMRGNFSEFEELLKEGIKKKHINKFVTEVLPVWNGCPETDPLLPLKNLDQRVKVVNLHSRASAQSVVIEGSLEFE